MVESGKRNKARRAGKISLQTVFNRVFNYETELK
jgi:hypothetical protein